tara:strand:+ start:7098 stop:8510 length:1413 start_codon:yes stop_codon:yes gene_type:complete
MKFLNKTYLYILLVLVSSCHDELDQNPITSKVANNSFATESDIENAVNGVYAALQNDGLYGLYIPAIGEISSDNTFDEVPTNDGGIYGELDEFSVIPANNLIGDIWRQSYVAIQRANVVINRIDNIAYASENLKSARIGEMKFIRAVLYFNMVRLFGDVPLVIQETSNPSEYIGQGRTSADAVYNQIETDLTEAINVLPIKSNVDATGKVSKGAAQALLGKVLLTLQRYDEAKTQLLAVANSSEYSLVPNVADIFGETNENNSETIFAVHFTSGLDGSSQGSKAFSQFSPSGTVSNSKGHNLPTVTLYNLFDANDLRKGTYLDITGSGIPFTTKLSPNNTNSDDGGSDWVILRYSDVVLMLAEVENELGNTITEAIPLLNSIRTRAGLPVTNATTQTDVRNAIALERRFELIGEGHRWFDLLRTNTAIETMNTWFSNNGLSLSIDQNDLLMPVPQSQIDTDPAIVQNPGY